MKTIRNIGLVYETENDAKVTGIPGERLYHWREKNELAAIAGAVKKAGFKAVLIGNPKELLSKADFYRKKIDFIFNLSVGFISRFRLAQAPCLYSLLGIPYSGADPYARMVSQHKPLQKLLFEKNGIPTPAWEYFQSVDGLRAIKLPKHPLIIKPAYEGSSIGVFPWSVSRNSKGTLKKIKKAMHCIKMPVIAEQFIAGKEFKIGIIGPESRPFTGMLEDTLKNGQPLGARFIHLYAKKDIEYSKVYRDIAGIEFRRMKTDCLKIYKLLGPMDYATFDIRVDMNGQYFFLEVNADATLHPDRTLAKCFGLNGIDYNSMIRLILISSLERQGLL